tara:strand:+ start:66 stop:638 length:573 start_codon:yes stop_codon:yes gene_type:complete
MKIFLIIFILIFSIQIWVKADDIRELQLEGVSIGDSLLNYMSKKKIDNIDPYIYPASNKYKEIIIDIDSNIYNQITASIKLKDIKYIIYSMMADISFKNNFEECLPQKKIIVNDINSILGDNAEVQNDKYKRNADKSGKSYDVSTTFFFKNGDNVRVICTYWSEEAQFGSRLTVALNSNEFYQWLLNEAY